MIADTRISHIEIGVYPAGFCGGFEIINIFKLWIKCGWITLTQNSIKLTNRNFDEMQLTG